MYYFILFKASWCGHCQHFIESAKPIITKYIKDNDDFYKYIEYDDDKNHDIMESEMINGYPTIRLYKGGSNKPYDKKLIEFSNRDPKHIVRVLNGFKKKMLGGANKIETFKPTSKPASSSSNNPYANGKVISYSSFYSNNNGIRNQKDEMIVCENGVCKRTSRIIDKDGKITKTKDITPYNITDNIDRYYDTALELRNHF